MANPLFKTVADLTTLDVTTLSGKIDIKLGTAATTADKAKSAFKDISSKIETAVAQGAVSGTVEVIGWTKVEFDKDVKQFFRSGLTPETATYLEAHNRAVETSLKQRSEFVKSAIKLIT